jgi:hypothetical protein
MPHAKFIKLLHVYTHEYDFISIQMLDVNKSKEWKQQNFVFSEQSKDTE